MNPLLVVIPTCADDGPYAERLLDWIYQLGGKTARGNILLVYAHDVHAEYRLRLKICAELAFESVSEFQATPRWHDPKTASTPEPKTKVEFTNNLWEQTARYVAGHFRWPWLWVEPDCVPLKPDWISRIADAYTKQPKKYLGGHLSRKVGQEDNLFLSRVSVYPMSAYSEIRPFIGSPPFEWAAGQHCIPRSTKSRLIQNTSYDGDLSKVRTDAVLLHNDKTGRLIEQLREKQPEVVPEFTEGQEVSVQIVDHTNGVFPPNMGDTTARAPFMGVEVQLDPEPPDKRTKAWKDWSRKRMSLNKV